MDYVKLSEITDFEVKSVGNYYWQKWDGTQMLKSQSYEKDYRQAWDVETDKGRLTASRDQVMQMLVGCMYQGKSDIIGKKFTVKTNGKTGKEIRYFINAAK